MPEDINHEQQETAEKNTSKEENGNFFSRYGKFFLIAIILIVQCSAAYFLVNTYYEDISDWMEAINPKEEAYHSFENIIINPQGSAGERYLLLSVVVEVGSGDDARLLENRQAEIVDRINTILTRRTVKELANLENREKLKQQIGSMINNLLEKKSVRNLFFTKYVLQ
ncbi:flagellar basal body-associated FliL family protein [Fodinibius sediminis]|uniref:Flagellar protein FliL n=1 Tax=Fodinibius sediminis TaxID=1214077 RepID=A0A521CIK3_9BACT|nr:flagellar basal body-associated FliL family protein [Fodinibius sediminis]SMO59258.1 Flagellar basal body-associated protein FliL [Fodinibius sediminis]